MGSFNTTCFASQQTISTHNKCYVLPIKQNSGYNAVELMSEGKTILASSIASSTCYPDCFWEPFGDFIPAVYDDYGQVQIDFNNENTYNIKLFLDELTKEIFVTTEGQNQSHDVPFDISDYKDQPIDEIWDALWTASVHELRVFVKPYQNNTPRQFTFAIISEQAYDYLLNSIESSKGYNGQSFNRETVISNLLQTIDSRMEKFNSPNQHGGKYAPGGEQYQSMLNHITHSEITELINRLSTVKHPLYLTDNTLDYADEFVKNGKFSIETVENIKKDMEFGYIMSGLDSLNIKISPIVYAGQDYDNSVGKSYAKFIKTVSSQINKQQESIYNE